LAVERRARRAAALQRLLENLQRVEVLGERERKRRRRRKRFRLRREASVAERATLLFVRA
jgi:hypothetical protein